MKVNDFKKLVREEIEIAMQEGSDAGEAAKFVNSKVKQADIDGIYSLEKISHPSSPGLKTGIVLMMRNKEQIILGINADGSIAALLNTSPKINQREY